VENIAPVKAREVSWVRKRKVSLQISVFLVCRG